MEAKLQRRVQRYGWDRAASHYEPYWRRQLEPAQRRLLELADLRPGDRVLDVACGTGLVTLPAAQVVGREGVVVATDISQGMLDALGEAAAERGIENLRLERRDAEDLGLADAGFDAALCALGLMYVPDPVRALDEMRRALRPGGRAAIAVWGARDRCGWAEIFPIVDARVETEVCPLFFQLGTGDALEITMEAVGFERIETERISTLLHYDSGADAVGAAFAGGPVALAHSRFDDRTRQEAHAEYLRSIEPYRDGENNHAYAIPGEFVIGIGRRAEA